MPNEVLTRSIVAVDLTGKVYTINEYKIEDERRYELYDHTEVAQTSQYIYQIEKNGIDLRAIY